MRVRAGWATIAADIERAVSGSQAAWVSVEAQAAVSHALALLQRDALAVVDNGSREEAADALGVRPKTLYGWIRAGGWLWRASAATRPRGRRASDDT